MTRSLPPGETKFLVADALGLLDLEALEARVVAELLRLRRGEDRGGTPRSLRAMSAYLDSLGVYVSPEWVRRIYAAIDPHPQQPAA